MKMLRSMFSGRVLLWGSLLVFTSNVQAGLIAESAVVYEEGNSSGRVVVYGVRQTGGGTSAIGYNSSNVPGFATAGSAMAEYGGLHAHAGSVAANPGFGATSEARGQGSAIWSDILTFSSTTLTGQAFARAFFSLSGALDSRSDLGGTLANSSVSAAVRVGRDYAFLTSGQIVSQNGVITTDDVSRGQAVNGDFDIEPVSDLTGLFAFDIPFVFGVAFQMTGELTAFTQAMSGVAGKVANAQSNFGSSGLWGGISEVHLADGTVLTDFSLSSDSGFDWSKAFPSGPVTAVPEPTSVWLIGVGLLGLLRVARRGQTAEQAATTARAVFN